MRPYKNKKTSGFTLVELSIVIVIIGLIIAGVTAGKSLVNTSRLRAQVTDLQIYSTAFNSFAAQYNAIPGDMKNASSYWETATDGDGSGYLNSSCDPANPTLTNIELYTLFQHLSLAKLIPIQYNNTYTLGTGYPALKIDKRKGIIAGNMSHPTSSASNYQLSEADASLKHKAALYLNVSSPSINGTGFNDSGVITPLQAYAIDSKIDDGIARKGIFKAYKAYTTGSNCLTGTDGDYLQTNNVVCQAEYILKN